MRKILRLREAWTAILSLTVLLTGLLSAPGTGSAADSLSGMDTRPVNKTCLAGDPPPSTETLQFTPVFEGLGGRKPFDIRLSPLDSNRLYYVTRTGLIWTFVTDSTGAVSGIQQVLDISDHVGINKDYNAYSEGGSEHYGISSFAFHPAFATNPNKRWMFLIVNGRQEGEATTTSYVYRYTLNADGVTFDRGSELLIIKQKQGQSWLHHFGNLVFGPDGMLYIGSGDGTLNGANFFDSIPAQRLDDIRGKLLRINVDASSAAQPYAIPSDNPFASVAGARGEIYAYGLRNPWRFSFDSVSGKLWLGDVGDYQWEEVDLIESGKNYGWNYYEGTACRATELGLTCPQSGTVPPVYEVAHNGDSIAMIGVGVYRGSALSSLTGKYLFRIYGRNQLYALSQSGGNYVASLVMENTPNVNTFFTDTQGEYYGVDIKGKVYKLTSATGSTTVTNLPTLLSQTGCVRPTNPRVAATGTIPYEVVSPLWSDGAVKRRWLALPDGGQITINDNGDFTFPNGTVLMKMFLFQGKPFETRLLKLHNNGEWSGSTYKWVGNDATLVDKDGEDIQVTNTSGNTISWHLPSRSECLTCHTQAAGYSIGPEIAQLNSVYKYPNTGRQGHQLATWSSLNLFTTALPDQIYNLPSLTPYWKSSISSIRRARSYLHANCSYCHRPGVDIRADMDLRYATPVTSMNICDATPRISDLGVVGAKLLDPQSPATSIIPLRMSLRGAEQMPPLGTHLSDNAYLLINTWIKRADVCNPVVDSDGDGIQDAADNCLLVANASQFDADNDGFGDRCDGDYNNDLVVNSVDRNMLLAAVQKGMVFGDTDYRSDFDFNYDGKVDSVDLQYFDTSLMGKAVGPSGYRKNK